MLFSVFEWAFTELTKAFQVGENEHEHHHNMISYPAYSGKNNSLLSRAQDGHSSILSKNY